MNIRVKSGELEPSVEATIAGSTTSQQVTTVEEQQGVALTSIAISLKRIADLLEKASKPPMMKQPPTN
jgi:hypothetical protein